MNFCAINARPTRKVFVYLFRCVCVNSSTIGYPSLFYMSEHEVKGLRLCDHGYINHKSYTCCIFVEELTYIDALSLSKVLNGPLYLKNLYDGLFANFIFAKNACVNLYFCSLSFFINCISFNVCLFVKISGTLYIKKFFIYVGGKKNTALRQGRLIPRTLSCYTNSVWIFCYFSCS